MYQPCYICLKVVKDTKHIALDEFDDPQVCCDECYEKAKIFFKDKERRRNNAKSRRSSETGE